MKLSSAFEKLKTKQYNMTPRERIMIIVGVGLAVILIAVYGIPSETTVEPTPPVNNSQNITMTPVQNAMPILTQAVPANQVNQTIRDPFATPPDAKDIKEAKSKVDLSVPPILNNVPAMVPKNFDGNKPQENLKLTGIVSGSDQRLAVIMSGNKSKSYKINDFVGGYKITNITQDAVLLTNGGSTLVISLDQARQRGGNRSDK